MQQKILRLLVVEKEEIYRYIYELLPSKGAIEIVDLVDDYDWKALQDAVAASHPDILLLGSQKLSSDFVAGLEKIRKDNTGLGVVIFATSYSNGDLEALRRLAQNTTGGIAVFSKQSLSQVDQVAGIITAVSYGHTILDPQFANVILTGKPESPFLEQLTNREMEILDLLARGLTNSAIGQMLYIDTKTVEHHLNNIYGKLKAEASDINRKHLRVTATRLYLQGLGKLEI